jgi:hypothetical protein
MSTLNKLIRERGKINVFKLILIYFLVLVSPALFRVLLGRVRVVHGPKAVAQLVHEGEVGFLGRNSPIFKNYFLIKNPCFVTGV